jgi:hypothetical protein
MSKENQYLNFHTDKDDSKKIREDLNKGFWEVWNNHLDRYDYEKHLKEYEEQTKKTFQTFLTMNPEYTKYYTGFITDKKKFEIVEYDCVEKQIIRTGKIYPILNKTKKNLFKGQMAYGFFVPKNLEKYEESCKSESSCDCSKEWYKEDGIYISSCQPKKYCCKMMKQQFSFCDMHGLDCPDYFIKYNPTGTYYIDTNKTWSISFCPFCGTKISDHSGKILLID